MAKENKNIIDISLDDILLEQVTEAAVPTAAALEAFYQAFATAAGPRAGTRAGAAIFNRLADRTFGPGVDTRELHDMIHRVMPDADIPGRNALRAGEAFTKAVAGGAGQIAKKFAFGAGSGMQVAKAAATGAGLGGLGTGLAVAGGVAGAAMAGRAAWNIWHSKMKPQTDALEGVLDELQARTTKLQSKAFTNAMTGFNQRFDTAMKGAAFRDSDRVILGQAMALIDFYNNLAQGMFKVQKMQAARDISGTGGKVGISGDSIKVVEQPKLQEEYSLQELFGFGKKKAEPQYQSDDTPDDDTTTDDKKTDSKKDTGKNWESKVNSVFTTLRGQALSGAPSKFTGAIKNMWATIGFKPQKTQLPPEFNQQAIDSLIAGLINTILAPGQGGAQGALKLSEMATGINEVLNKTLMEMSARYDLAVLTEDLQAFMMRTPELSALGQASAEAAKPPPPAEVKELQQTVPQISVNVNANAKADAGAATKAAAGGEPEKAADAPKEEPKAAEVAPAAGGADAASGAGASTGGGGTGGAGGVAAATGVATAAAGKTPAKEPKSGAPKAASGPTGPKLLDDATLRKLAPQALQLFQNQTQDRKAFARAAAAGNLRIGKKAVKLTPEQSNQLIDFIKGSVGADRSGGTQVNTGGQGVDMVGPNSSVAASLQDPTLMAKNKQRMKFIQDVQPMPQKVYDRASATTIQPPKKKIGIQSFLQAAKAGVKDVDGNLSIPQYNIVLNPQQQTQAKALGLLERLYRLLGLQKLLSERIAKLVNAKKVIKESARISNINDRLDVLTSYERQIEKSLNETVTRIRTLIVPVNIKFYA